MESNVEAAAVIIGIVNGAILATNPDKKGFVWFMVAIGAGVVLGALGYYGLTIESGLALAVGSSGAYKVAQVIGSK